MSGNIHDLDIDVGFSPVCGLLFGMVKYNYRRICRSTAGLSPFAADYRGPDGNRNSISQLIRHLTVVDLHWVYRLQRLDVPEELKARFGPMYDADGRLPEVTGVPLEALLQDYGEVHDMLKCVCMRIPDERLDEIVHFEFGQQATIRWAIWHVADHARHHFAHIAQMKKLWQSAGGA